MPNFYMLIGLPASGKSTYAKTLAEQENAVIISTDDIRKELFGDEAIQENERYNGNTVFCAAYDRIKLTMLEGKNIIFDATNINRKRRKHLLDLVKPENFLALAKTDYIYNYIAILIATPYEKCLQNNLMRKRVVPEEVIKRMMTNFEVPIRNEGWDSIKLYRPFKNWAPSGYKDYFSYCYKNTYIPHDCEPWHTGLIEGHIFVVCDEMKKADEVFGFCQVGLFHDIGKPYVKQYKPEKGRCVYYNHNNVSAYIYCCCQPIAFSFAYAFIIEKHMEAHHFDSDDECRAALSKKWEYDPEDIELIIKFGHYDSAGALAVEGTVLR